MSESPTSGERFVSSQDFFSLYENTTVVNKLDKNRKLLPDEEI